MSQKKEGPQSESKPGVKVQDLTPSKDAKGGARRTQSAFGGSSANRGGSAAEGGGTSAQGGGTSLEGTKNLD